MVEAKIAPKMSFSVRN